MDALGLEPRTVRLLAKSAYASLASHAFGVEPYAYHITKERTSRQKLPTGLKKGVKWTLWGSNPGPSGYLPNLLTHLWLRTPSALSRMLIILQKKEPAGRNCQLVFEKRSEMDALGLEPRTVRL